MVTPAEAAYSFDQALKEWATPCRIRYFSITYPNAGSSFDDDITLAQSGTDLWVSGIVHPIIAAEGAYEARPLAQGMTRQDSLHLYVSGGVPTSGLFKIGIGSPITRETSTITNGIQVWEVQGAIVYKKLHLQILTNGSLIGE